MMVTPRRVRMAGPWLLCATATSLSLAGGVEAQTPTGGRELVSLTFGSSTRPTNVTLQSGSMRPVTHLGQQMLLIPERTALLVQLPEVLPQDFSIEVDIVPKTCCQPEDFAIEGTARIDQGPTSANILWHHDVQSVIGGALDNYHTRLTEPLASTVPGKLTQIVINVQGDNITMLTNGQQVYSLSNRKFARNSILRVFLGGQNDTDRAMYLARLRVVAYSAVAAPVTSGAALANLTPIASRTISVAGFSGAGSSVRVMSRSFALSGFAATGTSAPVSSRVFTLTGFNASGTSTPVVSRSFTLSGFTANGTSQPVGSRTFLLGGFFAAGTSVPVASRTITLTGWTSAGIP